MNLEANSDIKSIQNERGSNIISFDATRCLILYQEKNFQTICEEIQHVLLFFAKNNYTTLENNVIEFLNHFLQTFFYLMCCPDFVIPTTCETLFVRLGNVICNMTAMSNYRTTCVPLSILLSQKTHNLTKILVLLNPYNPTMIDIKSLFDINSKLASIWYGRYLIHPGISAHPVCYNNLKHLLKHVDNRLQLDYIPISTVSFLVSYYDSENDRLLKNKLNTILKINNRFPSVRKTNKKKIAIASAKWYAKAAVYRCLSPLIYSLKNDYDLILINLATEKDPETDYSIFSKVIFVNIKEKRLVLTNLLYHNFHVIIYPDISMCDESVILSNMRISPIQITMYGHPVSTFGAEIDYFIGGQEIEDVAKAYQNYSERLVLIPGFAVNTVWPSYKKQDSYKPQEDKVFVGCSWSAAKYNYPMLLNLRKIIDRADRHVVFRIIVSDFINVPNGFFPFYKVLRDILGSEHIEVSTGRNYDDYMRYIEETDFGIDSYPFGSFNTFVDYLYLVKPFITYSSPKVYGRFAAAILRKLKIEDYIAYSAEEYISKIVELINNPRKLAQEKNKIDVKNIRQVLENLTDNSYFKKAIDHLIENHEKYTYQHTKDPILIK